jgi:Uri superfamily endonuclease
MVGGAGTYALILATRSRARLRVGALGRMDLRPGHFVYVGSALGAGGLRARLTHHLRVSRRTHWHIDYLRRHASIREAWVCRSDSVLEHTWARAFRSLPGARLPLVGFGSSDCSCAAHLFYFEATPSAPGVRRRLRAASRGAALRHLCARQLGALLAAPGPNQRAARRDPGCGSE